MHGDSNVKITILVVRIVAGIRIFVVIYNKFKLEFVLKFFPRRK
jgi:hypothetical protein